MTNVNELMGKVVVGSKAYTLGTVNGVEVDLAMWQVTHLHVSLSTEATRELGFRKPILGAVTVYVPVSLVQVAGDIIALNKGREEMRDVIEPQS